MDEKNGPRKPDSMADPSASCPVSVAMTTYNALSYLEAQLDSLRAQTRAADEVIIVDDASSDGTPAWIRTYIETHHLSGWHLIENKTNAGYIEAFRKSLGACHGEWIFLCDHDDIWLPGKIESMMQSVQACPAARAVFSSFDEIDAQSEPIAMAAHPGRANNGLIRRPLPAASLEGGLDPVFYEDLAAYNVAMGCSAMVRKDLARQYLSCTGLQVLPHDYALFALAALQQGLFYQDQILMHYRIHASNTLGLHRESRRKVRTQQAQEQARQKQELLLLSQTCVSNRNSESGRAAQKSAELSARFFKGRAEALKQGSIPQLVRLFPLSRHIPTAWKTVLQDIRVLIFPER